MEATVEQLRPNDPALSLAGLSAEERYRDALRLLFAVLISLMTHLAMTPLLEATVRAGEAAVQRPHQPVPLRLTLPTRFTVDGPDNAREPAPALASLETTFNLSGVEGTEPRDVDNSSISADALSDEVKVTYFEPEQLSRRARVVRDIPQSRPALVGLADQGKVVLVLFISESGQVDRVDVEASEVSEALAAELAREFREALFRPAEIDGVAVKSRMRIEATVIPP